MIRQLRAWHRRWFTLLAILLPILLYLALRDRSEVPRVEALPDVAEEAVRAPAERP